jgi:hypothetical protein
MTVVVRALDDEVQELERLLASSKDQLVPTLSS